MTALPTASQLAAFASNPAVAALAPARRWTVSDPQDKKPLDLVRIIASRRGEVPPYEPSIVGAKHRDHRCLVDLDTLTSQLEGPETTLANLAFFLDASLDGLAMVDIEPDCPPEVARRLLRTIPALMIEESMSGRGYHMLVKLPAAYRNHPDAAQKPALRHPEGHYEILLHHYATFTRRVLSIEQQPDQQALESLYDELASYARPSLRFDEIADVTHKPDIAYEDRRLNHICRIHISRTPEDFNHDMSRYEFSVMMALARRARATGGFEDLPENQVTWLTYAAAQQVLEHRDKHDGFRNGMPYLLHEAAKAAAATAG